MNQRATPKTRSIVRGIAAFVTIASPFAIGWNLETTFHVWQYSRSLVWLMAIVMSVLTYLEVSDRASVKLKGIIGVRFFKFRIATISLVFWFLIGLVSQWGLDFYVDESLEREPKPYVGEERSAKEEESGDLDLTPAEESSDSVTETAVGEKKKRLESGILRLESELTLIESFSTHQFSRDSSGRLIVEPMVEFDSLVSAPDIERAGDYSNTIYSILAQRAAKRSPKLGRYFNSRMSIRSFTRTLYDQIGDLRLPNIERIDDLSSNRDTVDAYLVWEKWVMGQWSPVIRAEVTLPDSLADIEVRSIVYDVKEYKDLPRTNEIMGGRKESTYAFNLERTTGPMTIELASLREWQPVSRDGNKVYFTLVFKPDRNVLYHGFWSGDVLLKTRDLTIFIGALDITTYSDSEGFFY